MTDAETINEMKVAGERFRDWMRVLIVAGVPADVLMVGFGSRLAMLLLRLTSPDGVKGVESDDGFIIGRVTFTGTLNLLMLGAAVGVIGAGVYRLVAPWLIGPAWFRRVTTGLAAGAVGGAMLVHADGIDFTVLQPTWFAIGLFVALPAVFGAFIGVFVDMAERPDTWLAQPGRRRWLVPLLLLLCSPPTVLVLAFAMPFVGACAVGAGIHQVQQVRRSRAYGVVIRSAWLSIAVVGLVALVNDARAIVA